MFDSMPKLLERSGTSDKGSITGFYTVLVDGDDMDEPVTDTVRGILDGHIVLDRKLANARHYPPIDVLASISRLAPSVAGPDSLHAASVITRYMADYARMEDFINAGAYRPGSNPAVDTAISKHDAIEAFLNQAVDEPSSLEETLTALSALAEVEISEEEMIDTKSKIKSSFQPAARKEKSKKENLAVPDANDVAMSLNSVASLFSSMPGMNILESAMSNANGFNSEDN